MNSYVYRYGQFVVKKSIDGDFVVVNIKSGYECHSHVKSFQAGKSLCKLAVKHKLPKNNDLYFIESLIRLTNNKKYLCELKQLKQNIIDNNLSNKRPIRVQKVNLHKEIDQCINEYFEKK